MGAGDIRKEYAPDPSISDIAFEDAYEAALTKAGWTMGRTDERSAGTPTTSAPTTTT